MFLYTSHNFEGGTVEMAREFYIFFIDYGYTKVQPPGVTVPILQVHLKIFVYKYMTPGMWSANAHIGMFDFSIPVV